MSSWSVLSANSNRQQFYNLLRNIFQARDIPGEHKDQFVWSFIEKILKLFQLKAKLLID